MLGLSCVKYKAIEIKNLQESLREIPACSNHQDGNNWSLRGKTLSDIFDKDEERDLLLEQQRQFEVERQHEDLHPSQEHEECPIYVWSRMSLGMVDFCVVAKLFVFSVTR